eukprot:9499298-Pyramimonas_sp.AAC.2
MSSPYSVAAAYLALGFGLGSGLDLGLGLALALLALGWLARDLALALDLPPALLLLGVDSGDSRPLECDAPPLCQLVLPLERLALRPWRGRLRPLPRLPDMAVARAPLKGDQRPWPTIARASRFPTFVIVGCYVLGGAPHLPVEARALAGRAAVGHGRRAERRRGAGAGSLGASASLDGHGQ